MLYAGDASSNNLEALSPHVAAEEGSCTQRAEMERTDGERKRRDGCSKEVDDFRKEIFKELESRQLYNAGEETTDVRLADGEEKRTEGGGGGRGKRQGGGVVWDVDRAEEGAIERKRKKGGERESVCTLQRGEGRDDGGGIKVTSGSSPSSISSPGAAPSAHTLLTSPRKNITCKLH
ncbi:hypothetical protein FQA47_005640 [Oryzias melastigma]|uniref:Uncharacterized protein n=1 Tax=Oryzias melastigma TaxID=30732 RepID=A0A834BWB8_ORYME|nr:hypothetical protein FQA47_005640 [Oryzias melastigma]